MYGIEDVRRTEYQNLRNFARSLYGPRRAAEKILAEAMAEVLTPRQEKLVRLYYLEQNSMDDIAEMLGINKSTVSRTLRRAREKLERCLRYGGRVLLFDDEW